MKKLLHWGRRWAALALALALMTSLCAVAETFHSDTMIVSDYGVREGYLLTEVLHQERRSDPWQRR